MNPRMSRTAIDANEGCTYCSLCFWYVDPDRYWYACDTSNWQHSLALRSGVKSMRGSNFLNNAFFYIAIFLVSMLYV